MVIGSTTFEALGRQKERTALTSRMEHIPVSLIKESDIQLRGAKKDDEKYKELLADITANGVQNAISVRNVGTADEPDYRVVDGLQRFSCAVDAGLETIPAQILDVDENNVLLRQIALNMHRIETKPVEYTKALLRIIASQPDMTKEELCDLLNKSEGWLNDRLSLVKLPDSIQTRVNEGEIPLSNAYALAKLPDEDEMFAYADQAASEAPADFIPVAAARVKELRKLKRGEEKPAPSPSPRLRKKGEILAEYSRTQGTNPANDFESGFRDALAWVVRMDPAAQEQFYAELKEKEAEKERKKAERAAEKAEKEGKSAPTLADLLK